MKKFNFLFMGLVSVLLCGTSCSNDTDMDNISPTAVQENDQQELHLCTSDFVNDKLLSESDTISQKGVILINYKWKNGQTIRIKFLNGEESAQKKVKEYASEWLKYANLKFQYVASNQDADIKIGFNWNGDPSNWSYSGIYNKKIDQDKASINLGEVSSRTPNSTFRRIVLHHFGHALGLEHEHQSPKANIDWNKTAVYAYYAKEGWDQSKVNRNYLNKLLTSETNSSTYDKASIMNLEIPESFTNNHFSVGVMSVLSEGDKSFIRQQYPGK